MTLLVALVGLTAGAQSLLVGDADQDGELSIADVTKTVNMVLGREAQTTIDLAALAYKVDNTALAGTWYLGTQAVTFGADGTTSYAGASTYEFRPLQGSLILYDSDDALLKTFTVLKITDEGLVLREEGGSIVDFSSTAPHEYVDLGLPSGTLWATMNIGAENPEDYGDYFAWGETEGYNDGKTTFNWSTYTLCNGSSTTLTKYCTDRNYGTVDTKTELDLEDDAAYVNWGPNWRMPSYAQQDELINSSYTTMVWTTMNGVNGRKITSRTNGNSIFLPAAGCLDDTSRYYEGSGGYYWLRTLNASYPYYARFLALDSIDVSTSFGNRNSGRSIRPVRNQ